MKIQFAGVGSAFTSADYYQTNAVVISESGKKLMIDCGGDARFSLGEIGIGAADLDAVYISHLHADHIGGLEWLGFSTYFNPNIPRPKLYCMDTLIEPLWGAIGPGLASIQGKEMYLKSYFEPIAIHENGSFVWEDIKFTPVQTVHVMSEYTIKYSYGLLIRENGKNKPTVFYTADTQFCPHQIFDFYDRADFIFHDCETSPFKSGVHSHYEDLCTLKDIVKDKIWLEHYQPGTDDNEKAIKDGFLGFVKKGQTFEF